MKFVWEESDVTCGRRVATSSHSEEAIIGYDPSADGEAKYNLVSLRDGALFVNRLTRAELVIRLNDGGNVPLTL